MRRLAVGRWFVGDKNGAGLCCVRGRGLVSSLACGGRVSPEMCDERAELAKGRGTGGGGGGGDIPGKREVLFDIHGSCVMFAILRWLLCRRTLHSLHRPRGGHTCRLAVVGSSFNY